MFQVESQCPECGHKKQVECKTRREMIEDFKNDPNFSAKNFTKEDAFMAIQAYDIDCQWCSERYILENSDNWEEIEKTIEENL